MIDDLRAYWRSLKAPHRGFIRDLEIGRSELPTIVIYSDNLEQFSEPQKQDLVAWLMSVLETMKSRGTPCTLEKRPDSTNPDKVGF